MGLSGFRVDSLGSASPVFGSGISIGSLALTPMHGNAQRKRERIVSRSFPREERRSYT